MVKKQSISSPGLEETKDWLYKQIQSAPRPLPPGHFPKILSEAGKQGFDRGNVMDILDLWLNYGYCVLEDGITSDISISPAGERFFYAREF